VSLSHADVLATIASYKDQKTALRGRKVRRRNLIEKIDIANVSGSDVELSALDFNLKEVEKEIAGIESNMEDLQRVAANSW
jgi:hypothetical protein